MIRDYIPESVKEVVRKYKTIKSFRGGENRIITYDIHPSVKLGHNIYLAKNVSLRENVRIDDYSYCSQNTIIFSKSSVGKFCSIGYNVQIGVPEHPLKFFQHLPQSIDNQSCPNIVTGLRMILIYR